MQRSVPQDAFVLKIQRELCHQRCARKVLGLSRNGQLFLKGPVIFRAYFGCHNSLYIFATLRLYAMKLRNHLGLSYIRLKLLKRSAFENTSGFTGLKNSRDFGETGPCSQHPMVFLRVPGFSCMPHILFWTRVVLGVIGKERFSNDCRITNT